MTSAKNPDGSVDYFAQHKSKSAPTIIHHTPESMKPKPVRPKPVLGKQNYSSEQQQKS